MIQKWVRPIQKRRLVRRKKRLLDVTCVVDRHILTALFAAFCRLSALLSFLNYRDGQPLGGHFWFQYIPLRLRRPLIFHFFKINF